MPASLGLTNPLSYMGVTSLNPPQLYFDDRDPTPDDLPNFRLGTLWINELDLDVYMLVNVELNIATWVPLGGSPGNIQTITTPDAVVVTPIDSNINFLNGVGMDITGSGNNVTFNSSGAPFLLAWEVVTDPTKDLVAQTGYFANNAGGVTFTLPATAAVGDAFVVSSMNAGGWTIAQNAGQNIQFGQFSTTTGVGGSLSTTQIGDTLMFVCNVADTTFTVINSMGNITYV